MLTFKDVPIKSKLKLLLGLTGGIALTVSATAFIVNDFGMIRSHTIETLTIVADTLTASTAAVLKSDDPLAARDVLDGLSRRGMIEGACIYDRYGRILSVYGGPDGDEFWTPAPRESGHYIGEGNIDVFRRISDGKVMLGTLFLRGHTREIYAQIQRSVIIVSSALVVSLVLSIVLSSGLQNLISRPILRLVRAVRTVSSKGDFAIRVSKETEDELGILSDGFNAMMEQLQERDNQIEENRIQSLEARHLTIFSMAKLAEKRNLETGQHLERISNYVRILAECLASSGRFAEMLTPERIEMMFLTSPLHDIGKVGIPDSILLKPGKLDEDEFEVMKRHTIIGAEAVGSALERYPDVEYLRIARDMALTHHEKFDGTGYPHGLVGEQIPLCGRIIALADVYDALTTERVYKEAIDVEEACEIIMEGNGMHFDPNVVEAFVLARQEFVSLSKASVGDSKVTGSNNIWKEGLVGSIALQGKL